MVALLINSEQSLEDLYGTDKARGQRIPLVFVPTVVGTFDQACVHATTQHFIKQPAKQIAVPKTAVSIFGKGRVIGDWEITSHLTSQLRCP